ncbi:unnamed protein product [Rotaria sp. Silwood1]|nr:unnamed protein product [Rotaria sp. Silwood1]CAF3410634.1 unnamed protein product [Rotaria sp. Silwood1]CAF3439808.1 unnamed protein product [Rotaria sp. Silwood1]CAF4700801.1 unnamed protein product [Rotaria sp. Silwood1]CAF4742352.1 unnamed protein product [Rotaria sp. Silwood1]
MASLGLHLLTVVLGVIFIFLGHIKLTPQFFPEYHTQARNEFGKLNKEFPFYHLTGWRPYAKNYRIAVGVAEMSSGTLLLLGGAFPQSMGNMVLLVIITNMIIAFQKLHYSMEYIGGAIFLAVLLILRLVLASTSKTTKVAKAAKRSSEKAE